MAGGKIVGFQEFRNARERRSVSSGMNCYHNPAWRIVGLLFVILPASLAHGQTPPAVDHHQHLFSPAVVTLLSDRATTSGDGLKPITAGDVVALLDAAGIQRAAILSVAYMFGSPARTVNQEYEKVKAENDWTAEQAASYPGRLVAFCSFNPLKGYALDELARCGGDARLRSGLKLHFGNSAVDYHNPAHVERLRQVFRAANEHRMPIVIHMRASISQRLAYGAAEARIFLNDILPAAPDVPIQIAHFAGAGEYSDPLIDQALAVFVDAIANNDPRTRQLYFDATAVVTPNTTREQADLIARRIRQLGVNRILYGTDAAAGGNLPPKESWAQFHRLPLSEDEFNAIASNAAPYMR